jgi:OFA family oxalate/formate antiporter-like MFS transporter
VVLVAVVAMFAATLTGGSGLSIFVLPISNDLGWDRKTIAGALGLGTILGALSAPFFGRLVDRYGARVMLTATGLGLALTLLPIAWVQLPLFFYLCYSSARLIDMGVLNTSATTAVANWFVRFRGRALGLTVAGNAIGVALVTPLAQWIIADWGWRLAWFVLTMIAVLTLTPLAWWLVRRRPEDIGLHPDGDPAPAVVAPGVAAGSEAAPLQVDWSLKSALRTWPYWLLVLSGSLTMFAIAGLSLHQAPTLVENGLEASTVAWLVSLYGFTWTFGSVAWGLVAERVPARYALAIAYAVAGGCMLAVVHIHDVGAAIIYAALYGLVNGGKETLDAVVWADYYGRREIGAIRGSSRPLIVGANAAGPFVAGWAYDSLGSYSLVLTAFGLLAISGGLLVLLARPPIARALPASNTSLQAPVVGQRRP